MKINTLNVGQLIDHLKQFPEDLPVVFQSDFGDYHHTQQALFIDDCSEVANISKTEYSTSKWKVDFNSQSTDSDNTVKALVLSYWEPL